MPCLKGRAAPITTQDNNKPKQSPSITLRRQFKRINDSLSPTSTGIAAAALNQFMVNVFLEEMKKTIQMNQTLVGPEEVANGVVPTVTKEAITEYRKIFDDPVM